MSFSFQAACRYVDTPPVGLSYGQHFSGGSQTKEKSQAKSGKKVEAEGVSVCCLCVCASAVV